VENAVMRWWPVALVAVVVLSGAVTAVALAGGDGARLSIVRSAPLTVRGTGFASSERVRVTLRTTTRTVVRSARTGPGGTFTARFPGVRITRCGEAALSAVGARGDRARLVRHRGVASCNPG
jgi:hypothetical protein